MPRIVITYIRWQIEYTNVVVDFHFLDFEGRNYIYIAKRYWFFWSLRMSGGVKYYVRQAIVIMSIILLCSAADGKIALVNWEPLRT